MGASDNSPKWEIGGVPQELVVNVVDASEEMQASMVKHLVKYGVDRTRFEPRWDTWKGFYLTPPYDAPSWTGDELTDIQEIIQRHSNVIAIDYSEGAGSKG